MPLVVIGVIASSCSSSGIRVETPTEGAEVFLVRPGRSEPTKLGVTPLVLTSSQLQGLDNGIVLRVTREGYRSETVSIPRGGTQTFGILRVELTRDQNACSDSMAQLNEITRQINNIVKLTSRRKLSDAESLAVEMSTKYPEISLIHDLLGNIHYLNRKPQAALDAYRRSLQLSPRNVDTQRMIEKLSAMGLKGN